MTAAPISRPPLRRAPSWAGRASQHRRWQVAASDAERARVDALWSSLVEVLRTIDSPSSALLCTADGAPLAAYGHPSTDLPEVCAAAAMTFAERVPPAPKQERAHGHVDTVELTAGGSSTVIASLPALPDGGHRLLVVSAEGVSVPLLHAWTRHAAEDLREALAQA